jgi:hypothetical protein
MRGGSSGNQISGVPVTGSAQEQGLKLEGPVAGRGHTAFAAYDLHDLGYEEEEYFVSGEAQGYRYAGQGGTPETRPVEPADRAGFRSRFVVRRPSDPSKYNGTVLVEWLNVSGGTDAEPDWGLMHRHIVREGFAWVGVSAQKVGIDGGGFSFEGANLKAVNPERYGSLVHPGDAYSFDIFSQVGRLLRDADAGGPLGPRNADRLIATGHSQSAAFLVTYINAVHPIAEVFDGFFVHGRGASAADMEGWRPAPRAAADATSGARALMSSQPVPIRGDVGVPVLTFQSETDVLELGGVRARQPDAENFRLWEVAGSAHAETYLLMVSHQDTGALSAEELAALYDSTQGVSRFPTEIPVNSGPQSHYVSHAALSHLDRWVRDGIAPPKVPVLEVAESGDRFVVDENGIARGGVRTPWVDVPVAILSGIGQTSDAMMAFLFGTTTMFTSEQLALLYPDGRESYVSEFSESLDRAIAAGVLVEADATEVRALALASFPG